MASEQRNRAADSAELLGRALRYALHSARAVTPALLGRATPCRDWDLEALLRHVNDSLAALREAAEEGGVSLSPAAEPVREDPAAAFRADASRLLAAVGHRNGPVTVTVAGLPVAAALVARVGALEVAVHGWDIARASGRPRPVPAALAARLLQTAHDVVPARRHPLFAPPVQVPAHCGPSDHLVAFLGREPHAGVPRGRG